MSALFEKVMVTGHRPQHMTGRQVEFGQAEIERVGLRLRDESGMRVGISGMALGADTWWASTTLWLGLDLWSFIPFPQQAHRWGPVDREIWQLHRSRAAHEHVTSLSYSVQALHERNDEMLNAADAVIAVWSPSKTTGGTASCVQKAIARRMPLIVVDLDELATTMRMPS